MIWTEATGERYRREGRRYASDTSAAEWRVISQLLSKQSGRGRRRRTPLRLIVDALLYRVMVGLSVAWSATRLSAAHDSAVSLLPLARSGLVAADQRAYGNVVTRTGGP